MSSIKKIFLGTDHAGFELKEEIKDFLESKKYNIEDCGAYTFEKLDDYPDFIIPVARNVSASPEEYRGIIFGGSGQGEAMSANRFKNVRATVFYGFDFEIIKLSRLHNNANILSIGARFVSSVNAKRAIELWLETPFEGGRHEARIKKIDDI